MTNAAKIEANEAVVVEAPNTPHELVPDGFRAWVKPAMPVLPVEEAAATCCEVPAQASRPVATRETVLSEASRLVAGPRQDEYGHPFVCHRRTAAFWSIRLEEKLKSPITPGEVAEMMVLLKSARLMEGYSRNSTVDQAGYAECRDLIEDHIIKASNGC